MTPEERKKLVDDMLRAYFRNMFDNSGMSAALAIAEAAIREDCAKIAKERLVIVLGDNFDEQHVNEIANSIAPDIASAILDSIPEQKS